MVSLHECRDCNQGVEVVYDSTKYRFGFSCACKAIWTRPVRKDAKWVTTEPYSK